MDGPSFMARWRKLPLWLRLAFPVLMPAVWLTMRFRGARKWLVEGLHNINDNDQPGDILPGEGVLGQLRDLLLNQRDAVLTQRCDTVIAAGDARTVAVVYGAAHMPALIRHLCGKHGYVPAGSEWMTAIAA